MICSQKLESIFQVSRIFIAEGNSIQLVPILTTPQNTFSFSPEQLLFITKNLFYLKDQLETRALCNFFLYGSSEVTDHYHIKMINMVREKQLNAPNAMKIITQIRPYYVLPKINLKLVLLYSSVIIFLSFTVGTLLWLFRNGYLTKKQFFLLLNRIRSGMFNFFRFLYAFLSKLLKGFKTVKTGIRSLPEKIVSEAIDVDSSPIDFLKEVQQSLDDINDIEKCKLFIIEMMHFGETGVTQVNKYKYTLKILRGLRKMGREYEADGKTHLIPEVTERIISSKNILKTLATSIQRIARVFRRKTELYSLALDTHDDLEALDDALFDRIQEIFEIFISFCKKYGIELNE